MKRLLLLVFGLPFIFGACDTDEDIPVGTDFNQEMREFIIGLSQYAKSINTGCF